MATVNTGPGRLNKIEIEHILGSHHETMPSVKMGGHFVSGASLHKECYCTL